VFNPGAEIDGVPVVGKRMAIFDDRMAEHYNYAIRVDNYKDSLSCYVFSCTVKSEEDEFPVVRSLNTWFDRRSFKIVYRDYRLKYSGLLFDFDVAMKVIMDIHGNEVYASKIEYSGFWDIPLRKKETVDFDLGFRIMPD